MENLYMKHLSGLCPESNQLLVPEHHSDAGNQSISIADAGGYVAQEFVSKRSQ